MATTALAMLSSLNYSPKLGMTSCAWMAVASVTVKASAHLLNQKIASLKTQLSFKIWSLTSLAIKILLS